MQKFWSFLVFVLVFVLSTTTATSAFGSHVSCRAFRSAETDPLKFYLAINLTFPQHGDLIVIGLTAAQTLNQAVWDRFQELPGDDVKKVWTAMVRAHQAHGVLKDVDEFEVWQLLQTFLHQGFHSVHSSRDFLAYIERRSGLKLVERRRLYAAAILEFLSTAEVHEYGKKLRIAAAAKDKNAVNVAIQAIKRKLIDGLEAQFPELAIPFYRWNPNYALIDEHVTVAKLLIDAYAYGLSPVKYAL